MTPLEFGKRLFFEVFIKYNFILNHFKIKISDNLLFGGTKQLKIGQFNIYLNFNRKILVALASFNKNDPYAITKHFNTTSFVI